MNKKKRREVLELSLLENPKMETQVKERTYKIVLRVVFISVLFLLLISGYVFQFSSNLVPKLGNYFVGTFNASNFYDANNCDLILIKKYDKKTDAKIGDVVCFSNNIEKGSGKLISKSGDIFTIETKDGKNKNISYSTVIGRQFKTVAVLGFFVEFITSYYGIITFSVVLIAYIAFITFSRINFENTKQGKLLYRKFRQAQKEEKNRLKLLKKLKSIEGINYIIASMLDGNYEQNKTKIIAFNQETKLALKDEYKYILGVIHDEYLTKKDLSREEKKRITSLIELLCLPKDFDLDIEYMSIDLLLKTHLVDFDAKSFSNSAIEFLSSNLDDDDLLNFGSILYILLYRNKKFRGDLKEVAVKFSEVVEKSNNLDKDVVVGVSKSINNLIK